MKPYFNLPQTILIQPPRPLPNEAGEWQLLLYPNKRIHSGKVTGRVIGDIDPSDEDFWHRFENWLNAGVDAWELSLFRVPTNESPYVSASHLRLHTVKNQLEFHWSIWNHQFPLADLPKIGELY